MTRFRIAVSATETFYDHGPAAGTSKTRKRAIWEGEERPLAELALGLELPASGVVPLRSMGDLTGEKDTVKVEVGNVLLIQQQRLPRWLGWRTLEKAALLSEADQ